MRAHVNISGAAILVLALLTASAAAQTSAQPANPSAGDSSNTAQAANTTAPDNGAASAAAPERLSDGTLAESANTTALATSTYHQPTGFLPGIKP